MDNLNKKQIVIYGGPLFDGRGKVYQDGAIYIKEGIIISVGDEEKVFEKIPKESSLDSYDSKGRVIFPGLINLHHHFYSAFAKGLAPQGPTDNFRNILENMWWKLDKALDKESVQLSAAVTVLDSVRAGVTTVFDHHASPYDIEGSLQAIAAITSRAGIQAVLCYEVSDRDGEDIFRIGLDENLSFIESYRDNEMLQGILGLHANFTLDDDSLNEVSHHFDPEVGIHIHCGEDRSDLDYCRELDYKGPADRLNRFDLLCNKSILAHGVHLSKEDVEILKQKRSVIVHNPESNMNNNVGVLSIPMPEDIMIGLGTDGMSSDMLKTLKSGFLSHRQNGVTSDIIMDNLSQYLFEANGKVASLFFGGKMGRLEAGAPADISIMDYIPYTEFNSDNIMGHILFGMGDIKAHMVMKRGKVLFEDGTFFTLDEELILQEATRASKRLWDKINE